MLFKDLLKVMGTTDCKVIRTNYETNSNDLLFIGNYCEDSTESDSYIMDLEINFFVPQSDILVIFVY